MSKKADILVVDDEKVIIDAVTKLCSLENYTVESVTSVKTALELVSKHNYPVIICDIMMPDGDGFQVLNEIHGKGKSCAVIMMTGYSTVENAVNSLYQGAVDFIPKPFTVDELLSSIFRAVRYLEIKQKQKGAGLNDQKAALYYVDCPSKYFRLGHASWLCEERDGSVLIGVCDLFLKTIESVSELELLNIEDEVVQGISCLSVKSFDERIHKVLSPVSGRILEVNQNLVSQVNLIEKDPYFEGWIYRVVPHDLGYEIKNLIPCSSDRTHIGIQ